MENEEILRRAIEESIVIRLPRQTLMTFGESNIYYYIVTELAGKLNAVREGRVIAERPRIVTPSYLIHLEGFSVESKRFMEMMARDHPQEQGVFYRYKNEFKEMNVVSSPLDELLGNLCGMVEKGQDPLSTVIKGVEKAWDVSLLKFTFEMTTRSFQRNLMEFQRAGLLDMDERGIPRDAKLWIEERFEEARESPSKAQELLLELRRWGLFEEYQDRFFRLFRRK